MFLFQDQYRYSTKKCRNKETRPEFTPRPPPGGPTRDYTNFIILGVILLVIIIIVIVIVVVFCRACMKPGATARTNRPRRKRSEGPMSSTNLKRVNSWHSVHDGCIDDDDPNARFVIQNRILVGILVGIILKFLRNFAVVCFLYKIPSGKVEKYQRKMNKVEEMLIDFSLVYFNFSCQRRRLLWNSWRIPN